MFNNKKCFFSNFSELAWNLRVRKIDSRHGKKRYRSRKWRGDAVPDMKSEEQLRLAEKKVRK